MPVKCYKSVHRPDHLTGGQRVDTHLLAKEVLVASSQEVRFDPSGVLNISMRKRSFPNVTHLLNTFIALVLDYI